MDVNLLQNDIECLVRTPVTNQNTRRVVPRTIQVKEVYKRIFHGHLQINQMSLV
jgi:hypothetical protein